MINDDAIELALDACFDAVFAPEGWTSAMDALATSLGALGCCLNPNSRAKVDRARLPASSRYRDMLDEFVAGNWKPHDLRNSRGWKLSVSGKPLVFESDCSSEEERRKLPVYQELFARHELEIFVGVGVRLDNEPWAFNLVRRETMGGFEYNGQDDLLRVRPSVNRLLKVANQVPITAARNAIGAFEQARIAAVLVDASGYVIQINPAATMLIDGGGLVIRHRRLMADTAAGDNQLQALIRLAVHQQHGIAPPAVYIQRPHKPPLIVEALELRNIRADMFGFNGALLLITDPKVPRKPRLKMMREAFGLTPQEARVARLMTSGMDAAEIADILQLRRSSVQQLVKTLLAKTSTRRQGALIAMLSRVPEDDGHDEP